MVRTAATLATLMLLTGCAGYTFDGDRISRAGDAMRDRPAPAPQDTSQRLRTTCVKQGVYVNCN